MTLEEVLALPETSTQMVRLTRLYDPEPVVIFEGPRQVYVNRFTPTAGKNKGKSRIISITCDSWAEGDINDIQLDGSIVVEDYQMEILRGSS